MEFLGKAVLLNKIDTDRIDGILQGGLAEKVEGYDEIMRERNKHVNTAVSSTTQRA